MPVRLTSTGTIGGVITLHGREWGTAAEIAQALGPDITIAMVRNWYRRDGLAGYRVGGTVRHPLDQAAQIERDKRLAKEETGRGRPRRLDMTQVAA